MANLDRPLAYGWGGNARPRSVKWETSLCEFLDRGSALPRQRRARNRKDLAPRGPPRARAQDRGYRVLAVTGVEKRGCPSYAVFQQLLQPLLVSAGSLPDPQKFAPADGARHADPGSGLPKGS